MSAREEVRARCSGMAPSDVRSLLLAAAEQLAVANSHESRTEEQVRRARSLPLGPPAFAAASCL